MARHGLRTRRVTRRRQLLGEIVASKDPVAERDKAKQAAMVGELCGLFLAEGGAAQKPTTVTFHRSHVRNHIDPLIGAKRLGEIARADVERFQAAVAAGKTASDRKGGKPRSRIRVGGGVGCARHAMITLAAIFAFGVRRGLVHKNPGVGVKRYAPGKSERFLSAAELARLGEALAKAEG